MALTFQERKLSVKNGNTFHMISSARSWLLIVLLSLCGCGESAEERRAAEATLDANHEPVVSCSTKDMQPLRISFFSHAESAAICNLMERTLRHRPSIASLRKLQKVLILMQLNGSKEDPKENTYQIMNVVEARGQQNSESAIASTFETIHKIYDAMQGRVSPGELNIMLRSMGPRATGLSDEGLINIAAVLSMQKKDAGK